MIKLITQRQALNSLIVLLATMLLFHTLLFLQIIPYAIVWARKIHSLPEMEIFEGISMGVNGFLILVLLIKANYVGIHIQGKILNAIIWFFVFLFGLNTIGNLFAKSKFEFYVFTTLTFISALLSLRIVIKNE